MHFEEYFIHTSSYTQEDLDALFEQGMSFNFFTVMMFFHISLSYVISAIMEEDDFEEAITCFSSYQTTLIEQFDNRTLSNLVELQKLD